MAGPWSRKALCGPTNRSPAERSAAVACGVKVEMVPVEAVRLRAEDRAKNPAGVVVHLAQDRAGSAPVPITQQGKSGPIPQLKARDVGRAALAVFTELRARLVVSRACGLNEVSGPARHAWDTVTSPQTKPLINRMPFLYLERPKSGAAVSCPASMIPRRMARVRVKYSCRNAPSPCRIAR